MVEIIEQQARHRDVAKVGVAAGLRDVRECRVFRVKRQRNKRHESMRFILELAQPDEMVDALFLGFHVAVEHGGVRPQPRFVSFFRRAQPHLAAGLVVANDLSHTRVKNLRTAARAGIHARFFHLSQRLLDGKLGDAREVMNLNHRERLDVHGRAALFQATHHLQVMIESEVRMQAADDVKFGSAFSRALFRALINFFESERVSARSIRIAAKGAQFTVGHAYVCRVDVPVDVEIGHVSVELFADIIGEPADSQKIRRTI